MFPWKSLPAALPPLASADKFVREVPVESLSPGIRPLGQLDESFIIATDDEGLLLIDQHVAHERILFDKYRTLEATRPAESQRLLIPETFDLTPAQAAVFDSVAPELENLRIRADASFGPHRGDQGHARGFAGQRSAQHARRSSGYG